MRVVGGAAWWLAEKSAVVVREENAFGALPHASFARQSREIQTWPLFLKILPRNSLLLYSSSLLFSGRFISYLPLIAIFYSPHESKVFSAEFAPFTFSLFFPMLERKRGKVNAAREAQLKRIDHEAYTCEGQNRPLSQKPRIVPSLLVFMKSYF